MLAVVGAVAARRRASVRPSRFDLNDRVEHDPDSSGERERKIEAWGEAGRETTQ